MLKTGRRFAGFRIIEQRLPRRAYVVIVLAKKKRQE
jgi:hypothetical protein